MNRRNALMAVAVSLAISAPVIADSNSLPATPREMAHCMMKRLKANNSESYRDAFKTCKAQFVSAQADRSNETAMTAPSEETKQRP